jgi:F0F1-type ATP synthase alpha subunit
MPNRIYKEDFSVYESDSGDAHCVEFRKIPWRDETGKIVSYADGVAQVYGLSNVMAGEMVEFEDC